MVQLLSHVQLMWPHGLQHTRLPCPLLSPRVCSNSCPLSQWCHPIILFSVTLFAFYLQSLPVSGPVPLSRLFTSGGQNIRASASASILPMSIQGFYTQTWCVFPKIPWLFILGFANVLQSVLYTAKSLDLRYSWARCKMPSGLPLIYISAVVSVLYCISII